MCTGPHAFIPVDNTARFRFNYLVNGEQAMNVIHVRMATAFAQADLDNMALILKTWWDTYMKSLTAAQTTLESIEATSLETEDDLRVVYTTGLPLAGTNANPPMPGGTSVAVAFKSAYSGRSKNGRWFVLGITEAAADGNTLTSTYRQALIDGFTELVVAISEYGNSAGLVIVSYCQNGVWRTAGATTLVDTIQVNQYIDSQRRRNKR